ncbi:hypothetical protein VV01_11100 [Luteipulveratus halotolerans]|uniref:DUF3152 domain-containing protein n=1 Tax=Luteipulveratus halotolerans TaxID=1631356 RepID=A0A0L6CPD3_9MICO|nr:hypothetical protein VV01_11100 [Luteipulveratus halotolerans]
MAAVAVLLAVGSSVLGLLHDDSAAAITPPKASLTRTSATPPAGSTSASSTSPSARPTSASSASAGASTSSVPDRGDGTLKPVLVPGADSTGAGRQVTYALEVEGGLSIDTGEVGATVGRVLRDPRGWQRQDKIRFVQVTPQQRASGVRPDVVISLVSPDKVDQMCAPLDTGGLWSCANKDHAVLSYRRWVEATPSYQGRVEPYRTYQINHEVGHELGHPHAQCPGAGQVAPVMLQQSMGLGGCKANAFPTVSKG